MKRKIPYIPLSTQLSSSAWETELRLRNIFSGPKKRPPALFLALVFAVCVLCGNLVSCQNAEVVKSYTPDITADLTFSLKEDGSTVSIDGSVDGINMNRTLWFTPSWYEQYDDPSTPLGSLMFSMPLCDNAVVCQLDACWTDESRSAVRVTATPRAILSSHFMPGKSIFAVTMDLSEGTLLEIDGCIPNLGPGGPELIPTEEEAVRTARIAAKLLTEAEGYYQSYAEDHVLLSLKAPLADGRTLTLDAVGKKLDEYHYGVREVLVYDGDALLQTVSVRDATEAVWGGDIEFYDYTECLSPEESMEALDLNFDGNTDFGLFGWIANNTIPYYYWQWDGERYRYACTLQGAEVRPETGEVSSAYKYGWGGAVYQRDYYRPDGDRDLYLVRQEREHSDFPNLDADRGCAIETWVPREGAVIRPGAAGQGEEDFVLIRREIPVREINPDNTVSHFTEIWELKDGRLQITSRDEYIEG